MLTIKELLVYKILRELYHWLFKYFIEPFKDLDYRIRTVTTEHFWEKKLNIKTAGSLLVLKDVTMFKDSNPCQPTPYHVIEAMLDQLRFAPDDVFVDLGCGKGRVILSIATKKLKKIIGIEARKDMFDMAMENLKKSKVKNTPVEIVNADVTTLDMREGTIFFLFYPFGKNTHEYVMQNIKSSLAVTPRQIRIIYFGGFQNYNIPGYEWVEYENSFSSSRFNYKVDIWRSKI